MRCFHHSIFFARYSKQLRSLYFPFPNSSNLAQTIRFLFRHPLSRNKERIKIHFNGEHSRQHRGIFSTSSRCNVLFTGYANKLKGVRMEIHITLKHLHCGCQNTSPFRVPRKPQALQPAAHLT